MCFIAHNITYIILIKQTVIIYVVIRMQPFCSSLNPKEKNPFVTCDICSQVQVVYAGELGPAESMCRLRSVWSTLSTQLLCARQCLAVCTFPSNSNHFFIILIHNGQGADFLWILLLLHHFGPLRHLSKSKASIVDLSENFSQQVLMGLAVHRERLLKRLGLLVTKQNNLTRFNNTGCSDAEKHMHIILEQNWVKT